MGGGCSRSGNISTVERPRQEILTVWGDPFSPDTRSILAIIRIGCGENFPLYLQEVDQFKGDLRREDYVKPNPSGPLPTLVEGRQVIIGGYVMCLRYLMSKHQQIRETLYPPDLKEHIDLMLEWFQNVMRVCSTKLIKMCIGPKAFGQPPFAQEDINRVQDEFFKVIVPAMDAGVKKSDYFCGDTLTAPDIIIYYELNTILILYKRQLNHQETPDLFAWHKKMSNNQEIAKGSVYENKLRNI